jgi:hypothetical protein
LTKFIIKNCGMCQWSFYWISQFDIWSLIVQFFSFSQELLTHMTWKLHSDTLQNSRKLKFGDAVKSKMKTFKILVLEVSCIWLRFSI